MKRLLGTLLTLGLLAAPTVATAEPSPYCRKVEARADGDAALLFAPKVQADAIKFPDSSAIDAGVLKGTGVQFRGGLSWSPLDFYKGFRVLRVAEADCKTHESIVSIQELLAHGEDFGRLPALRKQAAFLASSRTTWEAIAQKADERASAHVTPVLDANEVRIRVSELARRHAQIEGEIAALEARGLQEYRGMLSSLLESYNSNATRLEREATHIRSLDAWDVNVTGGVIPHAAPLDYYAVVHVSFNLGAFSRNAADTRYLDARAEEMRKARYETQSQIERFRRTAKVGANRARRETELLDKQIASIVTVRDALSTSDAPNAPHTLSIIELGRISLESERTFTSALAEELSRLEEKHDGH